ncbi:MAG: hypothetical protein CL677_01795 [Bdellovibrionaceae bacterium]|nr:hypothetical protein [Pseudobdellovibrionaceae bacterium]|tara:strand:+ start:258 stop:458 length:201 start_codon:yes stop_codon:yes gene_type:complete
MIRALLINNMVGDRIKKIRIKSALSRKQFCKIWEVSYIKLLLVEIGLSLIPLFKIGQLRQLSGFNI